MAKRIVKSPVGKISAAKRAAIRKAVREVIRERLAASGTTQEGNNAASNVRRRVS